MSLRAAHAIDSTAPVPLSPVEDISWRIDEHLSGAYRVAVVLRLTGCIEADLLTIALERLHRRHPKLHAVITKASDGSRRYEFDRVARAIPFEVIDYEGDASPWREETRRLMQARFPPQGPLIGVAVLRSRRLACSDVIVSVHHGIADGLSAIMLVGDLLTEYASAETHPGVPSPPPLPMITAARATPTGGWRGRLWLLRRYLRIQREERRSRQTPLPSADGIPPQSQWKHWVLSREETLRLVRRCRKEGTALSGAMVAAVWCGLMDCLPVSQAVFKCQFPFNLRESLEGPAGPVTPQDLGSFVSVMNCFYEVQQKPAFWSLARRAHDDVEAFARMGGPSFFYNLAAAVSKRVLASAAPVLMRSTRERVTLLATSYGVLNLQDAYGTLRPRECTLIFKTDAIGPSLVIEALLLGQRLNIGFAGDGLDPAFWERLQEAVHRHVIAAAGA